MEENQETANWIPFEQEETEEDDEDDREHEVLNVLMDKSKGYSEHKSIMMALNKNRHLIDGIWEEDDDSAMESEEYDDSETEESQSDDTDEED
uniref:Uncharacterized protein n=1 Tax=Magallana gigas TaxID=29159 RepID=A0A8W8LPV5_MAGGI